MRIGPKRMRGWPRRAAWTALFLLGSVVGGADQDQRGSTPVSVTATVIQSCTVEAVGRSRPTGRELPGVAAPVVNTGEAHRVRCGKRTMVYPLSSPAWAGALLDGTPVTVDLSADGTTLVVQF